MPGDMYTPLSFFFTPKYVCGVGVELRSVLIWSLLLSSTKNFMHAPGRTAQREMTQFGFLCIVITSAAAEDAPYEWQQLFQCRAADGFRPHVGHVAFRADLGGSQPKVAQNVSQP